MNCSARLFSVLSEAFTCLKQIKVTAKPSSRGHFGNAARLFLHRPSNTVYPYVEYCLPGLSNLAGGDLLVFLSLCDFRIITERSFSAGKNHKYLHTIAAGIVQRSLNVNECTARTLREFRQFQTVESSYHDNARCLGHLKIPHLPGLVLVRFIGPRAPRGKGKELFPNPEEVTDLSPLTPEMAKALEQSNSFSRELVILTNSSRGDKSWVEGTYLWGRRLTSDDAAILNGDYIVDASSSSEDRKVPDLIKNVQKSPSPRGESKRAPASSATDAAEELVNRAIFEAPTYQPSTSTYSKRPYSIDLSTVQRKDDPCPTTRVVQSKRPHVETVRPPTAPNSQGVETFTEWYRLYELDAAKTHWVAMGFPADSFSMDAYNYFMKV